MHVHEDNGTRRKQFFYKISIKFFTTYILNFFGQTHAKLRLVYQPEVILPTDGGPQCHGKASFPTAELTDSDGQDLLSRGKI